MRIALAQIKPLKGKVDKNIQTHIRYIETAAVKGSQVIFFPELSITSYEPSLAKELAFQFGDERLAVFQEKSNQYQMIIGVGIPLLVDSEIYIAMLVYQPDKEVSVYRKQFLHDDELPYFKEGAEQLYVDVEQEKIAPAICYESLKEAHLENVIRHNASVYLASVAKPKGGVEKAANYFQKASVKYNIPILMVNAIGWSDDFRSYGNSAVWNKQGEVVVALHENEEGILIYDSDKEVGIIEYL